MGKVQFKSLWIAMFMMVMSFQAYAISFQELSESARLTKARTLHTLARKFWPRMYERELPHWRSLAVACDKKAPALLNNADKIKKRLVHDPSKEIQLHFLTSHERAVLEASENVEANLLAKFDQHYEGVNKAISQEKAQALTPWGRTILNRVETLVTRKGQEVRTAIQAGDFKTCSRSLKGLLKGGRI